MDIKEKIRTIPIILFLITMNLFLMGCNKGNSTEEVKEVAVEVISVARKEIANGVSLTAQLQPSQNVMIFPKTPGLEVTALAVKLGQEVREGDFLFELDKTMVRKQVEQTKIVYDQARENYNAQRDRLEMPQKEEGDLPSREAMLFMGNPGVFNTSIPNNQLPSNFMANTGMGSETALGAAQTQLEQARRAYASSLEQLGEMEYFAPISGTISQLNVQEKQMVLNTQPAVVITNGEVLKATLHMSESLWKTLTIGDEVKVLIGDQETVGKIHALNPIADPRSSLYVAEILVDNGEKQWKAGAFSRITIEREKKEGAIVIPKDALLRVGQEYQVFVVEKNRAISKTVLTGIDGGTEVEILEGLVEGDQVIIKGQHYVQDQTPIIVVRGDQHEDD